MAARPMFPWILREALKGPVRGAREKLGTTAPGQVIQTNDPPGRFPKNELGQVSMSGMVKERHLTRLQ